ncbi:hypothetical protein SAMD00019534_125550 [Acytostelium subglobosum LB1]|uniref:hypothetical protein n=1 Tax=Acytostelium subglobosum LB1 TaxID=1410327 RepID=UPI00064490E1|nr:hypothetical protein SAMD00019534_125550 [Acytostelium subglobosum LB1]GAM29379.1 hypothetical protein SAMD00019534_125550 [Acytostelium subglobosum LB1]|eukprot:XP_012747684.1 hypothetical protein SAMD00019534_125550 [Acytostelium subglobosum LB1]
MNSELGWIIIFCNGTITTTDDGEFTKISTRQDMLQLLVDSTNVFVKRVWITRGLKPSIES